MENQKRTNPRKFVFGNERFGGSYTPGDFEINFPEDMSREEFGRLFHEKMLALHKKYDDSFEDEKAPRKSKKENLKPLSIRVKPHTKEFFKNHSILSPRDVLEMYEEFNNGSEAFINSLIEEEKELEEELAKIQEKLHNAKLFKEKLGDLELENDVLSDEDIIVKLQNKYPNTEIISFGNETSPEKAENEIIKYIQMYNTLEVSVSENDYLKLIVFGNAEPVLFYFKNECDDEEISDIISNVEEFCEENEIDFNTLG